MRPVRSLLHIPVPLRIIAIVLVAILIPSVLMTLLGLIAVYRAEPMVREQLAYPIQSKLDQLVARLSSEWEYRFQEMGRRISTGGPPGGNFASHAYVAEALVYSGGALRPPDEIEPSPSFEASPVHPGLTRARELEIQKRDHGQALELYRAVIASGPPEAAVEGLLGAARCHRELGEWREAVRLLRRVAERFGDTTDATGCLRAPAALLAIADASREGGDQLGEQLAVRELIAELRRLRQKLDPDQWSFYVSRLKRYPDAVPALAEGSPPPSPAASGPAADPAARSPVPVRQPIQGATAGQGAKTGQGWTAAGDAALAAGIEAHARSKSGGDAAGYHWVARGRDVAPFAYFRAKGGEIVYLRLEPDEYLRDVSFFSRELGLPERALRFTGSGGEPAGRSTDLDAAALELRPLASRPLPRPLQHLSVDYLPAPGQVTEDLRRLETSRVALFTWAIIVLVLMIILGVSLTLRSVLREMRVTKLKSDFVGFVTHELKTPLTAIRMFTETLLLDRVPDETERRRCIELIDKEAARLTRLIEQILEFSKIERRQRTFRFASADMAEVVDESVRLFLAHNRETGCEIEVNKAQERISRIKMDRAAMVELLLNLLSNALKYSRDSKKIMVNVRESINDITVEVVDRGVGIPKREHRKIFEQFYRAEDYLTREVEGTGLGLTFARYIAKMHHGDIKVTSAVNQGSTFTLELRKTHILAE